MQIDIDKIYQEHLELARDEDPDISDCQAHSLATEWTQEDVARQVGRYLDQKYWQKQDLINKAHFE